MVLGDGKHHDHEDWVYEWPGNIRVELDLAACLDALHGRAIPHIDSTQPQHPLQQVCLVRGIRYTEGFGEQLRGVLPVYTRSLNARQIMSDGIPKFTCKEDIPYCIWHPTTAKEDTYRRLLGTYGAEYPQLAYQVGRACAVAGYTKLYEELDILPDVHIAEEARESGSTEIFDVIMAQPVRYDIMNDYTLSVQLEARTPSNLNGDTAVSWMLNVKQEILFPASGYINPATGEFVVPSHRGFERQYFDLTEDMNIDEHASELHSQRLSTTRLEVQLLHEPLPTDLPTVQKDLLIVMAAYHGDIDRYARLRRPVFVLSEDYCCRRGCYHNPMFAMWWSKQPRKKPEGLQAAINACMIELNILSGAPYPDVDTPYTIWWPRTAREATYKELARLQPSMLPQILHACIEADYKDLFDELLPKVTPTKAIALAADQHRDVHFRTAMHQRIKSITEPLRTGADGAWRATEYASSDDVTLYMSNKLSISTSLGRDASSGEYCDASEAELNACLPESWRSDVTNRARLLCHIDYYHWPFRQGQM